MCGTGDAPAAAITVTGGGRSRSFGAFIAAANNDCPAADSPTGLVSVTVFGAQVEAGAAFVTLCLPRPDLLHDGDTFALEPDSQPVAAGSRVQLIDVQSEFDDGCRRTLPRDVTGTARFEGVCGDGVDPAGFALTLDGGATVDETCPGLPTVAVAVTISGRVAVRPR